MKRISLACAVVVSCLVLAAGLSGCLRQAGPALTWVDFLQALTTPETVARLDTPQSEIITSFDPTGGNDDYNHFLRKGPKGWVVLADLKGPGVLTRFWFTGADDGKKRFRFYFDGAWRPSMELTLDELTGGREPFLSPLAAYENYCWYSLVPIPYAKRLVIMTEEGGQRAGGWPRLFYQINYTRLPKTQRVRTFDGVVSEPDRAVLDGVRRQWARQDRAPISPAAKLSVGLLSLDPGAERWMTAITGPGIIRRIKATPKFEKIASAVDRESLLRDVVVRIRWDGSDVDSVSVPLGDFFGSMWRRTRYNSMFFGLTNDTFTCWFPMPFAKKAEITFENQGIVPVEIEAEVVWEPLQQWDPGWGYFHASWSGSTPQDIGQPHAILRTGGRGKYVGCLLGVVTLDKSWWILEGDETMHKDGGTSPYWHGTGLEDYFNGGWYYQNPLARPLHGMVTKSFFRIAQYRLHLVDAVNFDTAFNMVFERGPDNASQGWMESVAYYYMDRPAAVAFPLKAVAKRQPPQDALVQPSIMTDLLNSERLGDNRGARDYIDQYLEMYPDFPFAAILRLRQIAYTEEIEGFDAAWPLYQKFMTTETNEAALAQAKLLAWFHEAEDNALVTLYSTSQSSAMLDGQVVCRTERPDRTAFGGVKIRPGTHCLAAQCAWQSYPSWMQVCVKTRKGGLVASQPDWKYAFNVDGGWSSTGYPDGAWKMVGGTGVKGPPEEPYIWLEPNAFVGMQSRATGIRPHDEEWPNRQSRVVYRREFEVK